MKKILGALVCMLTLAGGAMEAKAALVTDWSYNLVSTSLGNFNTDFVTVSQGDNQKDQIHFTTGSFNTTLSPNGGATGDLIFTEPDGSASTENDNKLLNQTTTNTDAKNTPATKLADLSFQYVVNATADDGTALKMDITYTIPLYTYYDSTLQTAYVYYNNSEVSTMGATALTYDGFKYGITGVGLFVDNRALVSLSGGENDPNTYSGWAINADTMANHYKEYVVGGDSNVSLGAKETLGAYAITGVFSITNTDLTPQPTPEPATMLLMGAGLVGLGFVARRRNSK